MALSNGEYICMMFSVPPFRDLVPRIPYALILLHVFAPADSLSKTSARANSGLPIPEQAVPVGQLGGTDKSPLLSCDWAGLRGSYPLALADLCLGDKVLGPTVIRIQIAGRGHTRRAGGHRV